MTNWDKHGSLPGDARNVNAEWSLPELETWVSMLQDRLETLYFRTLDARMVITNMLEGVYPKMIENRLLESGDWDAVSEIHKRYARLPELSLRQTVEKIFNSESDPDPTLPPSEDFESLSWFKTWKKSPDVTRYIKLRDDFLNGIDPMRKSRRRERESQFADSYSSAFVRAIRNETNSLMRLFKHVVSIDNENFVTQAKYMRKFSIENNGTHGEESGQQNPTKKKKASNRTQPGTKWNAEQEDLLFWHGTVRRKCIACGEDSLRGIQTQMIPMMFDFHRARLYSHFVHSVVGDFWPHIFCSTPIQESDRNSIMPGLSLPPSPDCFLPLDLTDHVGSLSQRNGRPRRWLRHMSPPYNATELDAWKFPANQIRTLYLQKKLSPDAQLDDIVSLESLFDLGYGLSLMAPVYKRALQANSILMQIVQKLNVEASVFILPDLKASQHGRPKQDPIPFKCDKEYL